MKKFWILSMCLFLISPSVFSEEFLWSQTGGGPEGGYIYDVEIAGPAGKLIFLASEDGGCFKSMDGGFVWTKSGLYNKIIRTVTIDPVNTDIVYAGAWDGTIYKSFDQGMTWYERIDGLGGDGVMDIAIDSTDHTRIIAVTYGDGVFISDNGGDEWTEANTGLSSEYLNRIIQDPNIPETWYAGIYNNSAPLNISVDNGLTWASLSDGLPSSTCRDIAVSPSNSDIIYLALEDDWIYKTTDGGVIWDRQDSDNGLGGARSYTIRVHPDNPEVAWCGIRYEGLYSTLDGGANWTEIADNDLIPYPRFLTLDPTDPDTIFVSTLDGKGVFYSDDAGASWISRNRGLTNVKVECLAIHPTVRNLLYTGTQSRGIFRSVDYGRTWEERNVQLGSSNIYCIKTVGTDVYAGTPSGIFRALDGGNIWVELTEGIDDSDNIRAMDIHPNNPSIIILGAETVNDDDVYHGGIYVTQNKGESWTAYEIDTTFSSVSYIYDVKMLPTSPATIYAATSRGLYKSGNSGQSWTQTGLMGRSVETVTFDPATSGLIFAGAADGLWRSVDSGSSWELLIEFLDAEDMTYDISRTPTRIYATGEGGVFYSDDRGINWSTSIQGLTNWHCSSLVVDPFDPEVLYTGTRGSGVFSTADFIPPDPPENVAAIPLDQGVRLSWQLGDENDLAGYRVYYDTDEPGPPYSGTGSHLGASPVELEKITSLELFGLPNDTKCYIAITALDDVGNESYYSVEMMITPNPQPSIVMAGYGTTYLTAANGGALNMIAWVMDPEDDAIAGVEMYYAGQPTGVTLPEMIPDSGFYQLTMNLSGGIPATQFILELMATDSQNTPSTLWPYLTVRDYPWTKSGTTSYPPQTENHWWVEAHRISGGAAGPGGPFVYAAGYNMSTVSFQDGGMLNIVAVIVDPGDTISRVELLYQGMPTGVLLRDDGVSGDFAAGDGIYGLAVNIPADTLAPSEFMFSIEASNTNGESSDHWPYLVIH